MILVSEMFDPIDLRVCISAYGYFQMFGPRSNGSGTSWRPAVGQEAGREKIDVRLSKARRDMNIRRIAIDIARRSDLYQSSISQNPDAIGHCHGFNLVVRHVEER